MATMTAHTITTMATMMTTMANMMTTMATMMTTMATMMTTMATMMTTMATMMTAMATMITATTMKATMITTTTHPVITHHVSLVITLCNMRSSDLPRMQKPKDKYMKITAAHIMLCNTMVTISVGFIPHLVVTNIC